MIILNQVYKVLKQRIKAVEGIKKVDWYNEQYQNTEDEKATRYPAVYVEFMDPIYWKQGGDKFQHGTADIRLHIVLFDIKDSPVRTLEVAQTVFEAINSKGLYDDENVQLSTELVRSTSTFPKRYNQLKVAEIEFKCEIFDITGMPKMVEAPINDFIINRS